MKKLQRFDFVVCEGHDSNKLKFVYMSTNSQTGQMNGKSLENPSISNKVLDTVNNVMNGVSGIVKLADQPSSFQEQIQEKVANITNNKKEEASKVEENTTKNLEKEDKTKEIDNKIENKKPAEDENSQNADHNEKREQQNISEKDKEALDNERKKMEETLRDYTNRKQECQKIAKTEKEKLDQSLAKIQNPHLRNKLSKSFDVTKKWYEDGETVKQIDADGNITVKWFPGYLALLDLGKNAIKLSKKIAVSLDEMHGIEKLGSKFKAISKLGKQTEQDRSFFRQIFGVDAPENDSPKEIIEEEKKSRLIETKRQAGFYYEYWKRTKEKFLTSKIAELKENALESLRDESGEKNSEKENFIKLHFDEIQQQIDTIDENFVNILAIQGDCSGDEPFFAKIKDSTEFLKSLTNFGEGVLKDNLKDLNRIITKPNEAIEVLKMNDFFVDDNSRERFREKVQNSITIFNANYQTYKTKLKKIESIVKNDAGLSDEKFVLKYSCSKEEMEERLKRITEQEGNFDWLNKKVLNDKFLTNWFENFDSDDPVKNAYALREIAVLKNFEDGSEALKTVAKEYTDWLDEYHEKMKQPETVRTYQSFSLLTLWNIGKQAYEECTTVYKRYKDRQVADVGQAFFGKNSMLGKEFRRKSEESENSRVEQFQTQYKSFNGNRIMQALYETDNPDEVKACIGLAIEKGFLKWDDPKFWETLNRIQPVEIFMPSDINLQEDKIIEKVKRACDFLWDSDDFRQWETSLGDKLKAASDGFNSEFEKYQSIRGPRERILAEMLEAQRDGKYENVDPAKYFSFLRCAFDQGKMNGGPENDTRWYFLIKGVTSGILSRATFGRLNGELLAKAPHADFFQDKNAPKLNGRVVLPETPGAQRRNWEYSDFKEWDKYLTVESGELNPKKDSALMKKCRNFFYEYINQADDARGRVERFVRSANDNWDHDDAGLFVSLVNSDKMSTMLRRHSHGADKQTPDFWRMWLKGYISYFKTIYDIINEKDKSDYAVKNKEIWQAERTKYLEEVGQVMRYAMGLCHVLQGNVFFDEGKEGAGTTVFSREEWERPETEYSPCAAESRKQIFNMSKALLNKTGKLKNYSDNLFTLKAKEEGLTPVENDNSGLKFSEDAKTIFGEVKRLSNTTEGEKIFVDNTDAVWEVLKEQFGSK